MRIEIVRRDDGTKTGVLEVDYDGRVRLLEGTPELADFVARELEDGLPCLVDEWGPDDTQVAVPGIATPEDLFYEHRLSAFLVPVGLCAASQH